MKNIADLNDSCCSFCCFFLLMLYSTESGAAVCEYFMRNMCNRGPLCPFRHTKGEKTVVCKHWLRGLCKKGDQCEFLHEYDMTKMPECYFYSKFGEFVLMISGYYQHYICLLTFYESQVQDFNPATGWIFEKDPIIFEDIQRFWHFRDISEIFKELWTYMYSSGPSPSLLKIGELRKFSIMGISFFYGLS